MSKKYYSLLKVEETDVENKPVTDNDADFHKKQILHKLVVRNASTSENNILLDQGRHQCGWSTHDPAQRQPISSEQ